MKVLVACEFSGIVREAFAAKGHDAWSCDLLPSEKPGQHIQGDVLYHLKQVGAGYYDMIISHPPCTYLCNSGVRWLYKRGTTEIIEERWIKMKRASEFFKTFLTFPKVCIENPVPHGWADLPPSDQRIQPYQFGHGETKMTCLWLRGLPKLQYTDVVHGRTARVHRMAPNKDRWKDRSRTYQGIANAMAEQWG